MISTKEFFEIMRVSFRSTILGAIAVVIAGGTRIYAEHSFTYWALYFGFLFFVLCPFVFLFTRYIALPWLQGRK